MMACEFCMETNGKLPFFYVAIPFYYNTSTTIRYGPNSIATS